MNKNAEVIYIKCLIAIYTANYVAIHKQAPVKNKIIDLLKSKNTDNDLEEVKQLISTIEFQKGKIESIVYSLISQIDIDKPNIYFIASYLLDRIANAHAFVDGNKRTAILSAFYILRILTDKYIKLPAVPYTMSDYVINIVKHNFDIQAKRYDNIQNNIKEFVLLNRDKELRYTPNEDLNYFYDGIVSDCKDKNVIKLITILERQ